MPIRRRAAAVAACLLAAASAWSCGPRQSERPLAATPPPPPASPVVGGISAMPGVTPPPELAARPWQHRPLAAAEGIYFGRVPATDAEFDALAARGVKTIISVDGSPPDSERAEFRGIRPVHLPTSFGGIPRGCQAELARAARDLPGPVYICCHDGRNRSPAAAACAAILLGRIDAEQGLALLTNAGTSPAYAGLWSSVRLAPQAQAGAVDRAADEFPRAAEVSRLASSMVEMERAMQRLEGLRAEGWRGGAGAGSRIGSRGSPPTAAASAADAAGTADAQQIAAHLRALQRSDEVRRRNSSEFLYFLLAGTDRAEDLASAIARGEGAKALEASFQLVASSCADCHVRFRDK